MSYKDQWNLGSDDELNVDKRKRMEPNPPTEHKDFRELPASPVAEKISVPALGCVLLAGAYALLWILSFFPAFFPPFMDGFGAPSKIQIAWFFGLAALQVVLPIMGVSAVLRRRDKQAVALGTALIVTIVLMQLNLLIPRAPTGMR